MKRLVLFIVIFSIVIFSGCNQKQLDTVQNNNIPSRNSTKDSLNELANQDFTIHGENLDYNNGERIIDFGKAFVNLYNGAVAEQEKVSFEKYIGNKSLLKFTDKILELTQRQELQGGHGINYGLTNEFKQANLQHIEDNLYYLELPFEFEGSGMSCKMLITAESKSLKIVDFYFGNKDGVDTYATGHPAERDINNPKLWENKEWVKGVFGKLKDFEGMLENRGNKIRLSESNEKDSMNSKEALDSEIVKEYYFEPNVSIIEGTLITRLHYGPPGYGEDPTNDEKRYPFILQLDDPIKVIAEDTDDFNSTTSDVLEIQLVLMGEPFVEMAKQYKNKHIKVQGTLFSALTGYHYTEVLMTVDKILD